MKTYNRNFICDYKIKTVRLIVQMCPCLLSVSKGDENFLKWSLSNVEIHYMQTWITFQRQKNLISNKENKSNNGNDN